MKLVRYGAKGAEKPGLIDKSGQLRDLSAHVKDLDGEAYAPASLAKLAGARHLQASRRRRQAALRRAGHRHLEIRRDRPELCRPRQGNRRSPIPTEPIFFIKANTSLSRPERRGREAARLHQARLGSRDRRHHRHPRQICLAKPTRSTTSPAIASATTSPSAISRASAAASGPRASRTTPSARSARGSSPRTKSPTCRSCRCGSTSTASAARPASTSTMIFSMAKCISYVSQFMTLLPGDIVTTGTPPGVGLGMKPPTLPQCRRRRHARHRRPRRAAPGNHRGVSVIPRESGVSSTPRRR